MNNTIPIFTYTIIAITVIASIYGFSNSKILEKNTFSIKAIVKNKEFYRLITSQFFHVNYGHLIFNMFSFFSFGVLIENQFGPKITAVIYLFSAIGGDLLAILIKRNNLNYRAVGASGAVCGIIYASIFLLPGGSIYIIPIPVAMPSWVFAIGFMLVSLYGMGKGSLSIGHEAHLGGALTGILWAVVYRPSIIYEEYVLLLVLTVPVFVLMVYFVKKGNEKDSS